MTKTPAELRESAEITCDYCGQTFDRPHRRGPAPRFCCASHRQRAYETRREIKLLTRAMAHTLTLTQDEIQELIEVSNLLMLTDALVAKLCKAELEASMMNAHTCSAYTSRYLDTTSCSACVNDHAKSLVEEGEFASIEEAAAAILANA